MKERRRGIMGFSFTLVIGGVCLGMSISGTYLLESLILWLIGTVLILVGYTPQILRSAEKKHVDDSEE